METFRFLEPQWLWLPFLPIVAVVVANRLRNRSAVLFTGTEFLDELLTRPRGLGFQRAVLLASSMVLLLGFAEPRLEVSVESRRANVMLVMDVSGSMSASDVAPTRLTAAKAAAAAFVERLPEGWKAGGVAFSERAFVLTAPTDRPGSLLNSLNSLVAQGGTATGDAIDLAIDVGRSGGDDRLDEALRDRDGLSNPSATVIVLLSDGKQTGGNVDYLVAANRAAALGIPVYTIALGTDQGVIDIIYPDGETRPLEVPPDFQAAARIAQLTGGEFFTAVTETELAAVYASVSEVLEAEDRLRDPTALLVALALVLAALALLPALRMSRRSTPSEVAP